MGTQRELREDTPVEFVEVPLLAALGVAWGRRGYNHALAAIVRALRNANFGFELHRSNSWWSEDYGTVKEGFDIVLILPPGSCDEQISVPVVRSEFGLFFDATFELRSLVTPSAVHSCFVRLNPASLEDDERAQLGWTRVA